MTDQILLFALLAVLFALLIYGRWRYDVVAFSGLLVAILTGLVPLDEAFSGFGHPATVIIALVLILSRGLSRSGVIEHLGRLFVDASRKLGTHITIMSGLAAALSTVMNNVAALALLMPVDMQAASRAGRNPALTLMPLSFASILGGMVTLIGTPPNIIIAEYRNTALGTPYGMFDFAPVGLVVAAVGIVYLASIGWRLLPSADRASGGDSDHFELGDYVGQLKVSADSKIVGRRVRDLDDVPEVGNVEILGIIRRGERLPGFARRAEIRPGDVLVVEGDPSGIDEAVGRLGLEYLGSGARAMQDDHLEFGELVVPEASSVVGRSARDARFLYRYGVALVGVARQGRRFREDVRRLPLKPGDVLLLLGTGERIADVIGRLGLLPLRDRGQQVLRRDKAWLAIGLFGAGIALASAGLVYLPIALGCVVALYVLLDIVPVREVYDSVEWPVIVLLGSMIPIGSALESTGGTGLIAEGILALSAGYSPALVLALLVVITMTLSDVMNNTATAVIAAPVAVEIAGRLQASPDPFLMGVAVAASCAFLTPIGHKNNTLIMGPGGYRFGDYWRMGLPLEVLVVIVGVPAILWIWPL